ncbi:MAG: single-stranded DNA-binding protein [Candidatus Altiarchaeales archaeon]|nr:MAG: single-stranded DNA-binding protein [Candidatus Altiarchaeales archaeon]
MQVKDLKPNTAIDTLEVEVIDVEEPRKFTSFRGSGRVTNARVRDETGEVKLTLWNDEIDLATPGSKLRIENGWAKEYRNELQIGSGRFGRIIVEK